MDEHLYGAEAINEEPWVKLAAGNEVRDWNHENTVASNQMGRQLGKYKFYRYIFDFIQENGIKGDYHEFGCHRARTFRMALTEAKRQNLSSMRFWAYDSFEGLPKVTSNPTAEIWKEGALTTSERLFMKQIEDHGIWKEKVKTIKGFYNNTLKDPKTLERLSESKISLVCVDCDLYESAKDVFLFIEPLLQEGSVIYLDDIFVGYKGNPTAGVAKAFLEFQQYSSFRFIKHMDIGWWGRSYIAYKGKKLPGAL